MALVELSVMEQRYRAVLEVLSGCPVVEVAERFGVSRQSVHGWVRRYRDAGLAGLADRSRRPVSSPGRVAGEVEALVCELRRAHPRWGPRRLVYELARREVEPVPSRSTVYRVLVRNGLLQPGQRRRPRSSYRRFEREAPMALWQMDVVGGVMLTDGSECKVVTGIDDHSRFVTVAAVVRRASSRAVCGAFAQALARFGVPEEVLTDNGKQFTGKFTRPRPVEVLFDRICRDNGIAHRLTRVRSPTTTGKIERFHQTLRRELLEEHKPFADVAEAQAAVDAFVEQYNTQRPHQALGMVAPAVRFMAEPAPDVEVAPMGLRLPPSLAPATPAESAEPAGASSAPDGLRPVTVAGEAVALEFERVIPPSGNVGVLGRQVWMGPAQAGATVTVWTDGTTMNIFDASGQRVKTHPVNVSQADMARLRAQGARPGRDCAATAAVDDPQAAVEVDRWVNRSGLVGVGGRQFAVGMSLVGQHVTLRLEGAVLHVIANGTLWRSLANPVPPSKLARLHGARKAAPLPAQRAGAVEVQRVISSQGGCMVTGQTIQVGQQYRGKLVTITVEDTCFRVHHDGDDLGTFPRTTIKEITRYRANGHITYPT